MAHELIQKLRTACGDENVPLIVMLVAPDVDSVNDVPPIGCGVL